MKSTNGHHRVKAIAFHLGADKFDRLQCGNDQRSIMFVDGYAWRQLEDKARTTGRALCLLDKKAVGVEPRKKDTLDNAGYTFLTETKRFGTTGELMR